MWPGVSAVRCLLWLYEDDKYYRVPPRRGGMSSLTGGVQDARADKTTRSTWSTGSSSTDSSLKRPIPA